MTPVLLIDELDRSDEEFEAFLLELLSDFQISIPELGTISAETPPVVVVTSNRTREIHDALKRRCLYYWIDYPHFHKELNIVERKAPDVAPMLARQITAFIQDMRSMELFKKPGMRRNPGLDGGSHRAGSKRAFAGDGARYPRRDPQISR